MCDNIGYIIVEVCVMAIVQWQVNLLLILLLHWYTNFFFVANSFCRCKIGGETWHQIWVTTVPHALTDDYTQISMCKRTVNAVKYEL